MHILSTHSTIEPHILASTKVHFELGVNNLPLACRREQCTFLLNKSSFFCVWYLHTFMFWSFAAFCKISYLWSEFLTI